MNKEVNHFEDVTVLVTHYNRSTSLERLLIAFSKTGCSFKEIVVSDDGSKPEHIEYVENLKKKFDFKLVTTPKNSGLGNNINKGQDAVKTDYTLYVQEDFVPLEKFLSTFRNGLDIMQQNKEIDSVRFYAYTKYPKTKPYKDGFSEMIFDPWSLNEKKVHMYSDHPHLRRSNFLEKFGRYSEIKKSDQTEYDMMISFLKNKGKGLLFDDFRSVFDQVNTSDEPSTIKRNPLRYNSGFLISIPRYLFRILKLNYVYFIKK